MKQSTHYGGCGAVFTSLLYSRFKPGTHLLVIYLRYFMNVGLLVYLMHLIIAKFEQFNLHKAHCLTSSSFSNSSNPVAYSFTM